jgi:dTDP-L-oleandrosyltransferase
VRQSGCEPVPFAPPELAAEQEEQWKHVVTLPPSHPGWWDAAANVAFPWLLDNAVAVVEQVSEFYEKNPPDVVLYDTGAYAGRILAMRNSCPAIQTVPSFAPLKGFLHWENGVCRNPEPMLKFGERLDSFLCSFGINKKGNLWHTEGLGIYFIPRQVQYQPDSFDDRYCFVGPCLDRPFRRVWKNNSRGKPIVLVSDMAGYRDASFFNLITEALSGNNYHVILSVEDHVPESELSSLPDNFEVNRRASHLEILPNASLLVCRGGGGNTLEALYHGVPTIGIPLNPNHALWAHRMEELGLAIHIPKEGATVDRVRGAVDGAVGGFLRARIDEMKATIRECGGAVMAADKIEEFIRLTQ